ncbi:hypothetical protein NKH09_23765 [Mesorhizobium sp. M1339]|uniref:hypothetical protein n=1 Tax=Mesorhizobium sp. M1339 TaxID=2957086 RepID=UPI0033387965
MISPHGKGIWLPAIAAGWIALVRQLSGSPEVKALTADSRNLDLTNRAATTAWSGHNVLTWFSWCRRGRVLAKNERPVSFLQNNLAIELSTVAAAFERREISCCSARPAFTQICGIADQGKRAKRDVA